MSDMGKDTNKVFRDFWAKRLAARSGEVAKLLEPLKFAIYLGIGIIPSADELLTVARVLVCDGIRYVGK